MIYSINGTRGNPVHMVAKKPSTEMGRFCLIERKGCIDRA